MTTVDDLVKVFQCAIVDDAIAHRGNLDNLDRAGIRAVVERLRDELLPPHIHIAVSGQLLKTHVREVFNEILGDEGEKVAELTVGQRLIKAAKEAAAIARGEATDPAPAVCVWTGEEYVTYSTSCESEHEVDPHKAPPTYCPSCGKPITFKEAK